MSDAAPWEDYASAQAPLPAAHRPQAAPHISAALAALPTAPPPVTAALPKPGGGNDAAPWQDYAPTAAQAAAADPLSNMNWAQKAWGIVGSTAQDTIDAAKQRAHELGLGVDAPSEADIASHRADEQRLIDATTGGHVLHFALQAAPYIAAGFIPGMQGIAGGAALGALSGALTPTAAGESTGANIAMGGLLGGAIPGAMKGAGALWSRATGQGAANAAAEQIARAAIPDATAAAGADAAGAAGADAGASPGMLGSFLQRFTGPGKPDMQAVQNLTDQLRAYQPTQIAGVTIPQSAGAALDNAGLTRIEQGRLVKAPENWYPWKQSQAQAYLDALTGSTRSADDVEVLQDMRSAGWREGMAQAMQSVDPSAVGPAVNDLRAGLAARQVSPDAMRQGASAVFNQAASKLADIGEGITPEHLLEYRTGLNEGFNDGTIRLGSKNAAVGAVKDDFTQALDAMTGGQVSPVIKQFADASVPVNQAQAARNVQQAFLTPEGLPATTSKFQGIPNITEARLNKFIQAQTPTGGPNAGVSNLAPDVKANLQSLLDSIRQSQNVQALNAVGTPGGSATASNQFAAQMSDLMAQRMRGAIGKIPFAGKIINPVWDILGKNDLARQGAMLDTALQNPNTVMADMLENYAKSMGPQSAKAALVAQALRQAAVTGATQ